MNRFPLIVLVCSCIAGATVRNVACSGDITSALQDAITASADGDEVSIGAGSCTVSDMVALRDKNIDVHGAGVGTTTVTSTHANSILAVIINNPAKSSWQLHDFTLVDNGSNPFGLLQLNAGYASGLGSGWRIHHMRLSDGSAGTRGLFVMHGASYGLIDHVTFDMPHSGSTAIDVSFEMYSADIDVSHVYTLVPSASTLGGTYSKSLPLDLGTDKAMYVEDCGFNMAIPPTGPSGVLDSNSGGARVVFRHNTLNGYLYAHWTQNSGIYGTKYEVYNNTVNCQGSIFARMEAGTGVFWGNTISSDCSAGIWIDERRGERSEASGPLGSCDGTKPWDGNIEASGWPCLGQVGRGSGTPGVEESVPLYAWSNGPEATCATGGACTNTRNITLVGTGGSVAGSVFLKAAPHTNGDVDFVNGGTTPKPGYTAYTYPHPLQGGAAPTIGASSPLPSVTTGASYSQSLSASGGTAPLTCSLTAGSLTGSGLAVNSNCTVTGTAATAATYSFTATVTDANAATGSKAFAVTVNSGVAPAAASFTGTFTGKR